MEIEAIYGACVERMGSPENCHLAILTFATIIGFTGAGLWAAMLLDGNREKPKRPGPLFTIKGRIGLLLGVKKDEPKDLE